MLASTSRLHSENSDRSAAIGWSAWERRKVSQEASDRPRWRALPSRTRLGHRADDLLDRHARIDPVLVQHVDIVEAGFDAGIRFGESLAQDMVSTPLWCPSR